MLLADQKFFIPVEECHDGGLNNINASDAESSTVLQHVAAASVRVFDLERSHYHFKLLVFKVLRKSFTLAAAVPSRNDRQ